MAERNSNATSAPGGLMTVADARLAGGALLTPGGSAISALSGFRPGPGSPGAVTATGTPDGNVHVAAFQYFLQTGRGPDGSYTLTLDSSKSINVLSTPANPSNARHDLIIAQQSDLFYSDGDSVMSVKQVVGTPSGTPSDPAVTGSPDYVLLARVNVRAGTTSILTSDITDLRATQLYTVGLGGVLPVPSQTARNALTGMYAGMTIYRTDRKWTEQWDGTAWRVQGVAVVTSVGDLSAITDPYSGQVAYNTADTQPYYYNSGWVATWPAWTAYTPSLTGVTLGTGGTIVGRQMTVGKLCFFRWAMTLGTGGALTGGLQVGLPFTGLDANWAGSAFLFDNSTPGTRQSGSLNGSTTACQVFAPAGGQVTASNPFTWAVNDVAKGDGVYELA